MRGKWMLLTVLCCLLSAFIITVPTAAADPKPVIIDTDMTNDDFMAILYILNDPDFSVKAITVTGSGWSYCDAGVQAALGILALTKYGDVPVSCWKDTPWLGGDNPVNPDWRTSLESIKALNLPEGGKAVGMDAVFGAVRRRGHGSPALPPFQHSPARTQFDCVLPGHRADSFAPTAAIDHG